MPLKSKKSRVQLALRKKQKKDCEENERENAPMIIDDSNKPNPDDIDLAYTKNENRESKESDELRIAYVKHVSGHFNQGNFQFSEESRGRQCSCNALVMLCRIPSILYELNPEHLDQILIDGDYLYRSIIQELRNSDDFPESGYLAHDQLPPVCVLSDNSTYTIDYKPLRFCIYEHDETNDLQPFDVELQAAFTVSNSNILIFGSYMMAVYKDCSTGSYIFFDSHSRNEFGFLSETGEGNSVALVFSDFEKLHTYLKVLCRQLNVTTTVLGIQPLQIELTSETSSILDASVTVAAEEFENQPGCSSWTTDKSKRTNNLQHAIDQNRSHCTPCQNSSKPTIKQQNCYQTLPISRKNAILAQKRKRSKEQYQTPEYAERKRLRAREYSKKSYQNPENAERKREKAREQSKESYKNPENAQKKRQQNQNIKYRNKTHVNTVIAKFQQDCKEDHQLIYICQVCQRIFFKRQVVALYTNRYNRSILLESLPSNVDIKSLPINKDQHGSHGEMWICTTCHKDLLGNSVPRLATVNKLTLVEQPSVLSDMNMLERHLISPAILFMKMISLIKGAQKGITGQVVCVKSNVNNTATCLPRLPTEQSLIRVKLKRRLAYKGHHMCQHINPENVRRGLAWLKVNNPVFRDIDIDFTEFDISDDQLIADDRDQTDAPCELSAEPIDSDDTEIYNENEGHSNIQHMNKTDTNINVNEDEAMNFNEFDSILDSGLIANDSDQLHQVDTITTASTDPIDSEDTEIYEIDTYMNNSNEDVTNVCDNESQDDSYVHESHDEPNLDDNTNDNDADYITDTSAPLFSFLHPVDFAQYLADKHDDSILCLAPGEDNTPELVLQMEAKCFPVEFPDASNTFSEDRERKLSPSRYFNARIFSADNRFARNPEYIFFALYATEVQQIWDNICIALRTGNTKTIDGKDITASMLTDHEQVKKLIRRDQGYRFLSKIRGTPAYWETSKKDVFAMIRQLGIPTFFVTFSAADRRWIEIDNAILISQGKKPMTVEEHTNMTWEDHCKIIMSNPATAARMFQQRVYTFINDVILSQANPIGKVEDYYYRTEFQQRGWPHIHMIVWVKDAPLLDTDPDEDIVNFIDRYISCELPTEDDAELHEIVSNVQMHAKRHTKSCRKTGKVCRFNFPKPPTCKTFICRVAEPESVDNDLAENELEEIQLQESNAKSTIQKLWDAIEHNENADFDRILHVTQITHSEFEHALSILAKRNTVYLKRRTNELWVNNYNPHLIRCWNGNMDIQYVLDPFAAAVYMLSYLTKSEREMGDLLRNAQREAREGNTDAISELKKLGSVYLQHREVSVMGAIYLVCSMPLKQSSRYVEFIQTDVNGQKLSLPLRDLQENAGNSEEVWKSTKIEKYIGRPSTPKYKNMCMAKFFSTHYQVSSKTSTNESGSNEQQRQSDDEDNTTQEIDQQKQCPHTTKIIKLKNCSANMKERTKGKPAVIRYPRVSIKRDKERYHMNMLRLYFPHRTTEIKPESYNTYESYHLQGTDTINGETVSVQEIVQENMKEFEPDDYRIDNAWEALQEIPDLEDAWNALNPQAEQENLDNQLDQVRFDESDDDTFDVQIPEFQGQSRGQATTPRCAIETCRPQITEEEAKSMMRQLNDKQRQIFNFASKWCNDKARDHTVQPFHIFLTGGAGTGKSHVIRCITYYANKTFAPMIEDTDQVTVLLLAHTGTAAFNIYGETICSALKIPAKTPRHYTPLSEDSVNTLRIKYRHLQLVIIDEISMVSTPQFDYINGRLQQIKGTSGNSYFGNVSVLAVGDFHQLPPISPRTPLCFPREEILNDLWNILFQIVELTDIMRQRDDVIFAQMLNRLRIRKRNEPINEQDKKLLESRVLSMNDGLSAPDDALHLFYRNADVNDHNDKKINSLNTKTYTIQAIDVDQKDGRIIKVHNTPHRTTRKDDTTLADELKLAVNARVMLISNVDVSDGLCNGVSGIVKGIQFCNNQQMPTVVYVKFDSTRIGRKTRTNEFIPPQFEQCIPVKPRKESFQLKGKTFTTTREQIPLKLSWAVTIHKVQGQTTDQAVISLKGLQKAMAYVALSRITHLDGMYLTHFDESRIFCDDNVQTYIAAMTQCDLSRANPLLHVDHVTNLIILHHNIQSLNAHLEHMVTNTEIRKAHVICLSETWLENDNSLNSYNIDGYSLETINSGKGRGVAMYIQNSVKYERIFSSNEQFDLLAIRISGNTEMLITVIYKPVGTNTRDFSSEMTNLLTQFESLDTDYNVILGDFNHDLLKRPTIPAFDDYEQLIQQPTTSNGTLLDHIYIKPTPQEYTSSSMTTYYSYHEPIFVAIKH